MIDPLFDRFKPVEKGDWPNSASNDEWKFNFAGVRQRKLFTLGFDQQLQEQGETPYSSLEQIPPVGEEYFEWVAVLRSIEEAQNEFFMVELGAGFGRWIANAGVALRRYKPMPVHLVAVEAEPTHFEWIALHLKDNGLNSDWHTLVNAAVTDKPGKVNFQMGDPNQWYGQHISSHPDAKQKNSEKIPPLWRNPRSHIFNRYPWTLRVFTREGRSKSKEEKQRGIQTRLVDAVTLESVLAPLSFVNLIHMDIQGAELAVCRASIGILNSKVARVHIATHSPEVETGIRALFGGQGWLCEADYAGAGNRETPYGNAKFGDGLQTWSNPHLERTASSGGINHDN